MYGRTTPAAVRIATPRPSPAHRQPVPNSKSVRAISFVAFNQLPIRYRLLLGSGVLGLLTVFAALQVFDAYATVYDRFDTIGQTSSIRVDTAEAALQHIAGASTAIADMTNPLNDNQRQNSAIRTVYAEFAAFRADLFALHADLDTAEQPTFDTLENSVYNQFWPQLTVAIDAWQSGNHDAVRVAFSKADGYLEGDIRHSLQQIEAANFTAMKTTQQNAVVTIINLSLWLTFLLFSVAMGLSVLSVWLRFRIRRLITPGLDAALILAWALLIVTVRQTGAMPEALRSMVEDAYYSVTAASRVLATADQANRAESASLLDMSNAPTWQQAFDADARQIELRLCGVPGCLQTSFTSARDQIAVPVLSMGRWITASDSASIDGVIPLVANVTYPGEAQTLETARKDWLDYLTIDRQLRGLIASNQTNSAWLLDTGTNPGQSDEAFNRFSTAMNHERAINRAVFDDTWQREQSDLTSSRILLGIVGPLLLIGCLVLGTVQRYREL